MQGIVGVDEKKYTLRVACIYTMLVDIGTMSDHDVHH